MAQAKRIGATPGRFQADMERARTQIPDITVALDRYRDLLNAALEQAVRGARTRLTAAPVVAEQLDAFHGQIEYHMGWRDATLQATTWRPGKLLRPTLLLLACELAAGRAGADAAERAALARRAAPAGACVELVHNFSLIHDDIEDGDEERRGRPTLWRLWGMPQAINAGDGLFALARGELWRLVEQGVEARVVVELADLLDRTCLELCEGQYLDMRNEGRRDVSVGQYLAMIDRKTAALMACATEMGGRLGALDDAEVAGQLALFGRSLGVAFQVRDDVLGIWAADSLGKTAAGDVRRKKMTLPVIYALEAATSADRVALDAIYAAPGQADAEQIAATLAILERTGARARAQETVRAEGMRARTALAAVEGAAEAREAAGMLGTMLDFVLASV